MSNSVPCGIEVLLKKSAVDPEFRTLLLENPEAAAESIELELEPTEIALLRTMPVAQIEAVIDRTEVPDTQRRAFLGTAATVMLAAITGLKPTFAASLLPGSEGNVSRGDPKNAGRTIPWNPDEHPSPLSEAPRKPMTVTLDENGEIPWEIRLQAVVARVMGISYDDITPKTSIPYGKKEKLFGSRSVGRSLRFDLDWHFDLKIPLKTLKSLDTFGDLRDFVQASTIGYEKAKVEAGKPVEEPSLPRLPWDPKYHPMGACGGIRPEHRDEQFLLYGEKESKNPWHFFGGPIADNKPTGLDDVARFVGRGKKQSGRRTGAASRILVEDADYPLFRQALYDHYGVRMPMELLKSFETVRQLHRYLDAAWEGCEGPEKNTSPSNPFGDDFGRF